MFSYLFQGLNLSIFNIFSSFFKIKRDLIEIKLNAINSRLTYETGIFYPCIIVDCIKAGYNRDSQTFLCLPEIHQMLIRSGMNNIRMYLDHFSIKVIEFIEPFFKLIAF